VSGSDDMTLIIWGIEKEECLAVLRGHTSMITSICCLGEKSVVSASTDGSVRVWDMGYIDDETCVWTCGARLTGHTNGITCMTDIGDGLVVTGALDAQVIVWNIETRIRTQVLKIAIIS